VDEGIEEIKRRIAASRRVRISNVPMSLVEELVPLLKDKDVKIVLPKDGKATDELRQIGEIAIQKTKIYKDHKGTEANVGSIYFTDAIFNVAWTKNKILQTDAMNYNKCVKCMKKFFDVGWHYSEKVK
jgi:CRISPR/Cas system CMR subunit Cmr6 (Cas7 group RAMP superfamily)